MVGWRRQSPEQNGRDPSLASPHKEEEEKTINETRKEVKKGKGTFCGEQGIRGDREI